MSLTQGQMPDETTLIRYLVGAASDDEAEQLDERSIVDDEFVLRLRAVEYDLVDSYVNGELDGDTLARFKAQYLGSPSGLAKVAIAEALHARPVTDAAATHGPSNVRANRRRLPQWWMAAAAVLALVAAGYLFIDGVRLRRQVTAIREQQAALEQRERQLQQDLSRQQSATAAATEELARARAALAALPDRAPNPLPGILALMLAPATRGGSDPPTIAIPTGTTSVILRLPLLAVDFERYEAALKNAITDQVIWRSGRVRVPSSADRKVLPITVPAGVLAPGAFALELSGVPPNGPSEPLDSYPFRVVTPQ